MCHRQCHIDASRGVCETSLLAACVDAACVLTAHDAQEVLQIVHQYSCRTIPQVSLGTWTVNLLKESPSDLLSVSVKPETPTEEIPALRLSEIKENLSSGLESSSHDWVKHQASEIATEYVRVMASRQGKAELDAKVEPRLMYHILCILHCFQLMGVRKLSCSAIPIGDLEQSLEERMLKELLVGMAVNVGIHHKQSPCKSTALGVCIVRVLSGAHRSQPYQKPNTMTLAASGAGRSSTPSTVTIWVGSQIEQLEPATTDGHSENFQEPPLWLTDSVTHVQCNLDDCTGERLAFVVQLLLRHGAVDAWVAPIVMKKGRPAHTLHCLCNRNVEEKLLRLIFCHTTTIGVRLYRDLPRAKLVRSTISAQTPYLSTSRKGMVDVKVSSFTNGEIVSMKAEFDHCREIAEDSGIPLQRVSELALSAISEGSQTSQDGL